MPRVSVNMPCYNCEKHVGIAIESILNQTLQDFELIVVNDGSTDNSLNVIKSFSDSRIIIVNNSVNQGIVATRNIAIRRSSGEYIAILDSDDISCPNRLAEQVAFLDENPDYGVIGSWIEVIDDKGNATGEVRKTPDSSELIPVLSLFQNCFAQSSVLLRKSSLPDELYNPELSITEDYDLWIRILEKYKGSNLQKALVKYRVHPANNSKKTELIIGRLQKIIKYQLNKLGISPTEFELKIHTNFYGIGGFDIISLSEIEKWLLKIIKYNEESCTFSRKALEDIVWNLWVVVLYRQPFMKVIINGLSPISGIYQIPKYSSNDKLALVFRIITDRYKRWLVNIAVMLKLKARGMVSSSI